MIYALLCYHSLVDFWRILILSVCTLKTLFSCLQSINDGKYSGPCLNFSLFPWADFSCCLLECQLSLLIRFYFPLLAHFLVIMRRSIMRPTSFLDKQIEHRGVKWHVGSPWASCQIWNQIFFSLLFQFWGRFRDVLFLRDSYKDLMFDDTGMQSVLSKNTPDLTIFKPIQHNIKTVSFIFGV